VTNLNNGKQVIVRINDRGPFVANRIIDLSYVAAKKLDMLKIGTAPVEVEAIIPKKRLQLSRLIGPARKPPAPVTIKKTWLKVGAFLIRHNAEQNAEYIRRMTKRPTKIEPFTKNYFTFYRIVMGPFENVAQTQPTQAQLRKKGFNHILVKTTA